MATNKSHEYSLSLGWEGNQGAGTASYDVYGRGFRVRVAGKADLVGSADPLFRGDASVHNPEDLLLTPDGGGHFTEVTLNPRVTLAAGADVEEATRLHERAHAICFIASSCNFPIHCRPEVRHA
jgi:organic hydroperoxide reductase OsmC/OhrA